MDEQELEQRREQNRWDPKRQKEVPEEPKSSLPQGTIWLMTGTALFVDGVQALLLFLAIGTVADTFISIFFGLVFWFWFSLHGISFMSPKRLAAMGGGFTAELIPFANALPVWTTAVWYVISTTKITEKLQKLPGGKVASIVTQSKKQI
ncbi:MAG: hypothetical protein NTV02_01490 [Candidatus Zambryskibacteria bacterium]|nr:hypothetical protein [Candidatus Zambryskibacteria bacterium]